MALLDFACKMAQSMNYPEERLIVHRGLDPKGMLMGDDDLTCRVAGFGLESAAQGRCGLKLLTLHREVEELGGKGASLPTHHRCSLTKTSTRRAAAPRSLSSGQHLRQLATESPPGSWTSGPSECCSTRCSPMANVPMKVGHKAA